MSRPKRRRGWGEGQVVTRGRSLAIRWYEGGVLRFKSRVEGRAFASEEEAKAVLAQIVADIRAGRSPGAPDPKNPTPLSELGEEWLKRRALTHRSHRDDRSRWTTHWDPFLGHLMPDDVDTATIRRFVEKKLASLSSTTVGHCVRLLSSLFADLVERGFASKNPVAALPRGLRRLYRNAHDPKTTPFLARTEDIRRVYLALPERYGVMFALGALGGLRTGEVLGLAWEHVDLDAGRMVVQQQVHRGEIGPLKDDDPRVVPILVSLAPVLRAWKVRTGGKGLLFPPLVAKRGGRPGAPPQFVREHTLGKRLRAALDELKLNRPGLNWYRCTRHTFASTWVRGGGSLEALATVMGHADPATTRRYAHLRVDLFREADLAAVSVDLSRPGGTVLELAARPGVSANKRNLSTAGEETQSGIAASI